MEKKSLLEIAKPHYTRNQILELDHAIDFATKAHQGQKRLSGDLYITHPLSVARYLIEWGMDIDTVLAGVLHDTVEDTSTTIQEIEALFGGDVAFLVEGVTKVSEARSGMDDLDNYLPKTKDNLAKLLMAIGHDVRVIIIKLADRLHNLETLNYMSPHKQIKIARESLDIFGPIADRIGMGRVRMQIEDISFRYLAPREYRKVEHMLKKRLGKSTRRLGTVRSDVEKRLEQDNIKAEVNGRVKSVYSLYKKLKKTNNNIDEIYDLMALRIVVRTQDECYKVLGILHSMYEPMIGRIKDYIAQPKPNGYQSLHTTVQTQKDHHVVEFQIRTSKMHEYAEQGLAASFHYHEQKDSKDYINKRNRSSSLPKQLQWITDLQKVASRLRDNKESSREQLYLNLFDDTIFVYSPRGDIYSLPKGALPLDFAYLVHGDVGKHAYGFNVNGKIHAFNKSLESGDLVEVITKESASPKQAWQELVTTHHARNKLRMQLRQMGIIGVITNAAAIIRNKARRKK